MKAKKRLTIVLSIFIPTAVILLLFPFAFPFVGLFISTTYFDSNRLEFYDSYYYGVKLSRITGEVKTINLQGYPYNTIKEVVDDEGLIFPKSFESGTIRYFEYHETVKKINGYDRYEIFIEWKTDSISFEKEKSRLSSISSVGGDIKQSNDLFTLPSYVASYNSFSRFEYVLFDDSSFTLRYISLHVIGSLSNIVFPLDYAPTKVIKHSDLNKTVSISGSFSIYA